MKRLIYLLTMTLLILSFPIGSIFACGICDCDDYGPEPDGCKDTDPSTPCTKWGIWCVEDCDGDCGCTTDQCECGNDRTTCDPCPCTPGCSCSPSCPSGTSTNNTGPLCDVGRQSCYCTDDCGTGHTHYSDPHCFNPETALTTPSAPSWISIKFNTLDILLSQNEALRTLIPKPATSDNVSTTLPTFTYTGSRALIYNFRANNQGDTPNYPVWQEFWLAGVTPLTLRPEDIIVDAVNDNDVAFDPSSTSLNPIDVLLSNSIGVLWGHHSVLQKCQESWLSSTQVNGFYRVNTLPTVTTTTKTLNENTVTSGVANTCSSTEYVGKAINNPAHFSITYNDINHGTYKDVEALYVWFSLSDNPPVLSDILTSGTVNPSKNDYFGFMVRQEATTWNNVPNVSNQIGNVNGLWGTGTSIYASSIEPGDEWAFKKIADGRIIGSNNLMMAQVHTVSVEQVGNDLTLDFSVTFYPDGATAEQVEDGEYKIYAGVSDHFNFLPQGGTVPTSQPVWADKGTRLKVDLTDPIVIQMEKPPRVYSSLEMEFNVPTSDNYSGIKKTLGDAFRTGDDVIVNDQISKVSPLPIKTGYFDENGLVEVVPSEINWLVVQPQYQSFNSTSNLWSSGINVLSQNIRVHIGDNEGGGFLFYSTVFDKACNYSEPGGSSVSNYPDIGSPWLMTKGGILFSEGGTSVAVKNIEPIGDDEYNFHTTKNSTLNDLFNLEFGFNRTQTQIGSDLLLSGNSFLNTFIAANDIDAFRTLNYIDKNNTKDYWYDHLKEKYELNKVNIEDESLYNDHEASINGFMSSTASRYISSLGGGTDYESYVIDYNGNLNINSGLICNRKALIMVKGNLMILPDVTRANPDNLSLNPPGVHDGCLFLVSGNITIQAGKRVSTTISYPSYDIVEGLFISDNQIIIPEVDLVDPNPIVARDGLKIQGGIYGFASVDSPGILPNRSLKLADNTGYPSEAVHYDPRYLEIVKYFFKGINYTFSREIGAK